MPSSQRLVLGTRGSALAFAQTEGLRDELIRAHPGLEITIRTIKTRGDSDAAPLWAIGGQGLFTKELEDALRSGAIDAAVHSLKDLPTAQPGDFVLGAVTKREDPRDALVTRDGAAFEALPPRTAVGTSSLRRMAQLVSARPDLSPRNLRGNVDTRLGKVASGELPAAILASAGLKRLGRRPEGVKTCPLPPEVFVPAAGQGALAIEARAGDTRVLDLLRPLHDPESDACTRAERALLARLGVGCHVPLGAHATLKDGTLMLRAFLAYPDGHGVIRETASAPASDPDGLAEGVAGILKARGADDILAFVNAAFDKALAKDKK